MNTGGRLLAVDWGERRIGLALTDESQQLAQPLTTLTRRPGKRPPVAAILKHAADHQVVGLVVGLPLDEAGEEGASAAAARELALALGRRSGLPVAMQDERMSTARVLRTVREIGGSTRGRKAEVDAMAAALLLQQYLDARRGTSL